MRERVKKKANIATIADIIVLVVMTLLNPMLFPQTSPPTIPDKLVKLYVPQLTIDSIQHAITQTKKEIDEISYYLRLHHVTDDGYNLVAQYNTILQQRLHQLKQKQLTATKTQEASKTIGWLRIVAKDRSLIAVKMQNGYWKAGRYYTIPLRGEGCGGR